MSLRILEHGFLFEQHSVKTQNISSACDWEKCAFKDLMSLSFFSLNVEIILVFQINWDDLVTESRWIPLRLFYLRLKLKKKNKKTKNTSSWRAIIDKEFLGLCLDSLASRPNTGGCGPDSGHLCLPLSFGVERKNCFHQILCKAGIPPPPSLQMICHSLILNTIIDSSFNPTSFPPPPRPAFFLGSSRNDFNYLHNQILIPASVKVCSHRWQGLFSLALGDRETGCFKMRTSCFHRALFNGGPLCTQAFTQVSHYAKPRISSIWSITLY